MKHLLTTTALGLILAVSPAAAQDQKPADQPAQQSQGQQPGSPMTPGAQPDAAQSPSAADKQDMQKPGTAAQSGASGAQFVQEQKSSDGLASDLIGVTVTNANDETIGEIDDLLFDDNGQITGVVIGVGGFLGIGGKDVAVSFEDLQMTKDQNNAMKVTLNTSREALDSAPEFMSLADKQAEQDRAARQSSSPSPGGGSPMGGGAPRTQ